MGHDPESPLDSLWKEYSLVFKQFDDLTLARWLAQTLGQLEGKVWRLSHPLVGAYRLGAQIAHDRQIWFKRLATPPAAYPESGCCRAPQLPLFTRDIVQSGLICQHCNATLIAFDDLPGTLQELIKDWGQEYEPVHAVAHQEEPQQSSRATYDRAYEKAAQQAEVLLAYAGKTIAPKLLEFYPAVIWEDQDECLEVRPEDIPMA